MIIIRTVFAGTERTWNFLESDKDSWDYEFAKHGGDYRIPAILEAIEDFPSGYEGEENNNIEWWKE